MYNGHADVTRLIDENGEVSEKYYYDEFGKETGSFRFGDVTGDGNVNINDFSMIKRYLFMDSSELSKVQQKLSDLNADGKVDENDLNLLKEIISVTIKNCPADTNKDGFVNENNSIKYSGYYYDAETGLYYLNSRFYDPENARFMQEDSYDGDVYDPLSLNLYTYCANNPISYYDPTGHSLKSIAKSAKKAVKSAGKAIKKAANSVKETVKETVEAAIVTRQIVKVAAKPIVNTVVESVLENDSWETGISQLKESGTAGKLFASYSEGAVDNVKNFISGTILLVMDPVDTVGEMIESFIDDPLNNNPIMKWTPVS